MTRLFLFIMLRLTFTLDPGSKKALYEQLYEAIKAQILDGTVHAGEAIPSKRSIARDLKLSHSTVESAYALLLAEGYIESRPRRGYFARPVEVYRPGNTPALSAGPAASSEKPAEKKETSSYEAAKIPGRPVIEFSTGAVDTNIFPYSSWVRLYREVLYEKKLQKGPAQGERELRQALCDMLTAYRGVRTDPGHIVIGAGVDYLLDMIFQMFPSQHLVAAEDPGYPAVCRCAAQNGKTVVPLPVDEEGAQIGALAHRPEVRLCFVTPSHQFPCGVTMTIRRRQELLRWASLGGGYILEDDYDSEFRYQTRPLSCLQGLDQEGRVIYIGTFSRSVAPSIRTAYMVLPDALMERYHAMFDKSSPSVSRTEQLVLARFLHDGLYVRHVRRSARLYDERRRHLIRLLSQQIPGAQISGEEAGLHFLLHLPGVDRSRLLEKAQQEGLILHEIGEYASGPFKDHARSRQTVLLIGFADMDEEKSEKAVHLLSQCVQAVTKTS